MFVITTSLSNSLPSLIPKLDTAASTVLSPGFVFGTQLKPVASGTILMARRLVPGVLLFLL